MGGFDRVELNGVTWQTKALGKRYRILKPGDEARVEALADSDEEYAICDAYEYTDLPAEYIVRVYAIEDLLIRDGRIVGLYEHPDYPEDEEEDEDPPPPMLSFDEYGRSINAQIAPLLGIEPPHLPRRPIPREPRHPRPRRPRRNRPREEG